MVSGRFSNNVNVEHVKLNISTGSMPMPFFFFVFLGVGWGCWGKMIWQNANVEMDVQLRLRLNKIRNDQML